MNNKQEEDVPPELEQYLSLLKRMYERMERDNSWPWVIDPEGWAKFEKSQRNEKRRK